MSRNRKILLVITIVIIAFCYAFLLYLTIDNTDNTPRNPRVAKTHETTRQYSSHQTHKSKYAGYQLQNGSSPFDSCFGKGIYNGNATLTIKNGASSDAVICLYSIALDRTIRNEYVQRNTNFTMTDIAQGRYKIRVFYGNDWNPELENPCGGKGYFESNVSFSEFDKPQYFEDSYNGYTVATVTLYTVTGGNASTSRINQSTFFEN
ncbi:hypothetical protein D0T49_03680 [Paludibacter sp. 221]|uniref:hypothetical protein n=1 Tax=Paludibacter sp. 221 TaxID=2302939 RepID=UPI0013D8CD6A|nr:hypothetical protein [Paludibacter sp. 221]NDV46141.1 hypothetical protein [Paludibacter sp. 221]